MLFHSDRWKRRLTAAVLAGVSAVCGSVSAYAAGTPQTHTVNGVTATVKTGIWSYDPAKNQADIEERIFDRTGVRLEVGAGTLVERDPFAEAGEQSGKPSQAAPQAVSKPTALAPYQPYTANWSGTVNYTFTGYYFKAVGFDTEANGSHYVSYYLTDGTLIGSVVAASSGGKYRTEVGLSGPSYYAVITNTSGSSSSGAYYTAE